MADNPQELDYSNLLNCRIEIATATATSTSSSSMSGSVLVPHSSVRLSQECYSAANVSLPTLYHFALEKSILQKHKSTTTVSGAAAAAATTITTATTTIGGSCSTEGDNNSRSMVQRMQSVTNANEQVCVSILESSHYDLKTAIEAYFQSTANTSQQQQQQQRMS